MLLILAAESVGPKPAHHNASDTVFGVPLLQMRCALDSGEQCLQEHFDTFDFFSRGFYATGAPQSGYGQYNIAEIPAYVDVIIFTTPHYDILEIRENYTLNVTAEGVSVHADNGFALARALQTLCQLIVPLDAANPSAYGIGEQNISDQPYFRYRGLTLDVTKTYLPVSVLETVIDGLSCAKFNALHLRVIGADSSPLAFVSEPAERISLGAYDQRHIYSLEVFHALEIYALSRGVFVIPEISNPGHAASLSEGYNGLIIDCGTSESSSFNPVDNRTQEIFKAAISDLQASVFGNLTMRHIIHLGNDGFDQSCWENNWEIQQFMQEKEINISGLYMQYLQNQTTNVKKVYEGLEYPVTIYYEEALMAHAAIDKQSVVHFQNSASLNLALERGFFAIRSTGWELDKMWPVPTPTFYYGELWKDIFGIDILAGVNESYSDRVIGGAASMKSDAGSQNILGHVFPKLFAVGEVLWANEPSRSSSSIANRLQSEICLLKRMGMNSGPLWPSAPCWFEQF